MLETKIDAAALRAHFRKDSPGRRESRARVDGVGGRIAGCTALTLSPISDHRGDLFELLTHGDNGTLEPIVHSYQVFCEAGSIRGWVYHAKQAYRLSYTTGSFRIGLYDLRPESPTCGNRIALAAGAAAPTLLYIPAFVAHVVQNVGEERASFVNMPTNIYRHDDPDKYRLPFDSPLIPSPW